MGLKRMIRNCSTERSSIRLSEAYEERDDDILHENITAFSIKDKLKISVVIDRCCDLEFAIK